MFKLNNKLCIGTANFGQRYGFKKNMQLAQHEIQKIICYAESVGINTIDTARNYGDSEKILGRHLNNNWQIISKIPPMTKSNSKFDSWANSQIKECLMNLERNNIYGLLFHDVRELFSSNGLKLYEEIYKLKINKTVKKIGISIYNPLDLEILSKKIEFDIVQVPFNIFDRRLFETRWLHKLSKKGIEVHVRSIFLQGMLLKNFNELPENFKNFKNQWDKWTKWLHSNDISALETCLNFVLSYKEIDKIILGVDSKQNLVEIVNLVNNFKNKKFPKFLINPDDDFLINPMKWNSN